MKNLLLLLSIFLSLQLIAQNTQYQIDSLISEGNYLQALDEAKALVSEDSLNADNWGLLGKTYRLNLKYTNAIKAYERANDLKPEDKSLLLTLAKIYHTAGEQNKAIEVYKQVLGLDSSNTAAWVSLSALYIKTMKFDDAYKIFNHLYLSDTLNSEYVRQMGYCQYRMGEIVVAFELYKKSYRLNPENLKTIYWLADVYTNSQKYDSTINMVSEALKVYPGNGKLYAKRGNAYFKKNHHYLSSADYQKAIDLGYKSYLVQKYLGKSLYAIKKYDEARETLEQLIVRDTADFQICMYLGGIYNELKDYKKSLLFYEFAIDLLKPEPMSMVAIYRGMEITYRNLHQYHKEIAAIKKRHVYQKQFADFDYHLLEIATIYEDDLHDKKSALKYYQKYYDMIKNIDNDYYQQKAEKLLAKINRLKEDLHFEQ